MSRSHFDSQMASARADAVKRTDAWSPEAREAAAEARKAGGSSPAESGSKVQAAYSKFKASGSAHHLRGYKKEAQRHFGEHGKLHDVIDE